MAESTSGANGLGGINAMATLDDLEKRVKILEAAIRTAATAGGVEFLVSRLAQDLSELTTRVAELEKKPEKPGKGLAELEKKPEKPGKGLAELEKKPEKPGKG
jgi:hypothetical protein